MRIEFNNFVAESLRAGDESVYRLYRKNGDESIAIGYYYSKLDAVSLSCRVDNLYCVTELCNKIKNGIFSE